MDIKEILSDLSQAYGVSGSEGNAAEVALNILRNYVILCLSNEVLQFKIAFLLRSVFFF